MRNPSWKSKSGARVCLFLPQESLDQLEDIQNACHLPSRSSVIAQAIARWHTSDPTVETALDRKAKAKSA